MFLREGMNAIKTLPTKDFLAITPEKTNKMLPTKILKTLPTKIFFLAA